MSLSLTFELCGLGTLFNAAATELWGRVPTVGKDCWCGSHAIADASGRQVPFDQHPMALAIHDGRPIRAVEMIIVRPDLPVVTYWRSWSLCAMPLAQ